jgi:subtilisin family serine protease
MTLSIFRTFAVAGAAAAKKNNSEVVGVAAGATVVSVRVLDRLGFGYNDEVLKGLDHVAADGACGRDEVINMSLSDDATATGALDIDLMVEAMAQAGCLFALAAGNETRNVSNVSPAGVDHANIFTVSAIDSNDNFASFSNYGAGVDRAAPGVNVVSLKRGKGTESKNGTSMAAPHVAGLLALGATGCLGSDGTVLSGDTDGSPDPIAHLDPSC